MLASNKLVLANCQQRLNKQQQHHLWRQRHALTSAPGTTIIYNGQRYINFCSNDYLGLANNADIIAAYKKGLDFYGCGSGAAQLISGYSEAHQLLEQTLAAFSGFSRVLLFANGYAANMALLTTLVGKQDAVFIDRHSHASIQEGARFCSAKMWRYHHNDLLRLKQLLHYSSGQQKLIYTDALFSMDGDIVNLPALVDLAQQNAAALMIDDAHGFGVLGKNGRGTLEHFAVPPTQIDALMATFGKALGCYGAFVAADDALIETLIQFARPYIYSTALPAAMAMAVQKSLQMMQQESWRRERLAYLIQYFRHHAAQLNLAVMPSTTAIQGIIIGSAKTSLAISEALLQRGIYLLAMRPPTVAKNSSRLRITLSALHTEQQIDQLLDALTEVIQHD